MKKNLRTIIIILLLLFALWNVVRFLLLQSKTEIVKHGVIEDTVAAQAYVFKDETIVTAEGGVLQPAKRDGERVEKGGRIAVLMAQGTDEDALAALLDVSDRVKQLSTVSSTAETEDTVRIDEQLTETAHTIISEATGGNLEAIGSLKEELLLLKDKKAAASGKKDELLATLNSRKSALEAETGSSVRELYSPTAGVFYMRTDGYENICTPKALETLTVSAFASIAAAAPTPVAGCKVVGNYGWYFAAEVDARQILPDVGKYVNVRFNDIGGTTMKVFLQSVSPVEDGKKIAVFAANKTPGDLLMRRKISIDIIVNRKEGLRVPSRAITTENGETGVYVKTVSGHEFKEIKVLAQNDTYAIVSDSEANSIRLYDTVVL